MSAGVRAAIFAINCFIAAMLALYVAFSLDLKSPGWAMTTVFITSSPLSGALRSKAVYRLIGTALGAAAMVAIVPNLVNSPVLTTLAVASWVAVCLYLSLLDRTPRAYVFTLAGYTAALIGFPSVAVPDQVFDIAVARVEEITVGALCAAFIHGLIFPVSVAAAMRQKLDAVLADAKRWMKGTNAGEPQAELAQISQRLAASITELAVLGTNLRFDAGADPLGTRIVRTFDERLVAVLPLHDSVADRVRVLHQLGPLPPRAAAAIAAVREWLGAPAPRQAELFEIALAACRAAMPELSAQSSWQDLITASLATRLIEFIESWHDCLELAARVLDRTYQMKLRLKLSTSPNKSLHVDPGIAALTAAAAAIAICAASTFWIATAWPQGSGAVAFAAVACSLFGTLDDPTQPMRRLVLGFIIMLPVVGFYEFFVLPVIVDFPMLVLSLAPMLLPAAFVMGFPAYYPLGFTIALAICIQLAFGTSYNAELAVFLNSNIGLVIGSVVGLIVTQYMRVIGTRESARRLVLSGLRDLSEIARGTLRSDRVDWASRMLDRVGLLLPRLSNVGNDPEFRYAATLADLRLGVALIELRAAQHELPRLDQDRLEHLLQGLAHHFRDRARGKQGELGEPFLRELDGFIENLLADASLNSQRHSAAVATGLRRTLFPNAAPPDKTEPSAERHIMALPSGAGGRI